MKISLTDKNWKLTDKLCRNCGGKVELLVFRKSVDTGLTTWGTLAEKNICQTCVDTVDFLEWIAQ